MLKNLSLAFAPKTLSYTSLFGLHGYRLMNHMIDQILIMTDAGLSLFNWNPEGNSSDSNLISGFLTALNVFAAGERGEQIRKITMDPTTFLFDRVGDLLFVILTKDPEFEKVIAIILAEIQQQFLATFPRNYKLFRWERAEIFSLQRKHPRNTATTRLL